MEEKIINIINAQGDKDTKATVIHKNNIDYIPKISTIIPIYNAEKYLHECLDTIIKQTLKEIEIICVDDGSTDSSLEILKEYAKKDNRITILTQKNLGAGIARNAGLAIARGEFISFLDSDDFFAKKMFETLYKTAIKEKSEIVQCCYKFYDDKKKKVKPRFKLKTFIKNNLEEKNTTITNDPKLLYTKSYPNAWSKLFKKELIDRTQIKFESLKAVNDLTFVFSIMPLAKKVTFINRPYIFYRINRNGSITEKRGKDINCFISAIKKTTQNLKKHNLSSQYEEQLYKRVTSCANYELSFCPEGKYEKTLQKVQEIFPENLKEKIGHIPVVIASDDNYTMPTAVCMLSILENTSSNIHFIILKDKIKRRNKLKIENSLKNYENFTISYIDMEKYDLNKFPKIDRYNVSTFSRFFIPEICSIYKKVIYTDPDVIFTKDIKDYYNIDLENYGLAASVEEIGEERKGNYNHEHRKQIFQINQDHKYFAAGNLIIDCEYWRKNNITEKLLNLVEQHKENLVCPDLDVLNILFANNYKKLDFKYCCCVHRVKHTNNNKEMLDAFKDPFIIHYSGLFKPWDTEKVIFSKEFETLVKKTKFKTLFYKKRLITKIKELFK